MIVFDCRTEKATYRTLIVLHAERIDYQVTSTEDAKGKITFHIICKVQPEKEAELIRKRNSYVFA